MNESVHAFSSFTGLSHCSSTNEVDTCCCVEGVCLGPLCYLSFYSCTYPNELEVGGVDPHTYIFSPQVEQRTGSEVEIIMCDVLI